MANPILEVIQNKEFRLGGPEYGEHFRFADPVKVLDQVEGGFTPPVDLTDASRLVKTTREFRGLPKDQQLVDNEMLEQTTKELNARYGDWNWQLARVASSFDEARGDDGFWQPQYIVLLK